MFFGLDVEKFLLLGVVAVMVIGPQKLPGIARRFAQFVVKARGWAGEAKTRIKDEMGDELEDVQWRQLDPRQYDPRRIIRQALLEEPASVPAARPSAPPVRLEPVDAEGRGSTASADGRDTDAVTG